MVLLSIEIDLSIILIELKNNFVIYRLKLLFYFIYDNILLRILMVVLVLL